MKMKKVKSFFLAVMLSTVVATGVSNITDALEPVCVYALEDLGGESDSSEVGSTESSGEESSNPLGDYIKEQHGMTGEQLNNASEKLSPITNIFGNIVGGIVVLIFTGVFVITALDILYIVIPPIRGILYSGNAQQGAGMGASPMGGYGRGAYGMNSMMGGMQGGQAMPKPRQFISDEAVACVAMMGGSQQGTMGTMSMGQQPQQMPMGSVLGSYFKKRVFFMILLAVCVIVLTSSVLLGTGVNLAEWFIKLINGVNNSIPK